MNPTDARPDRPAPADADADRVNALADSIAASTQSFERLQHLRDDVHDVLNEEFAIVAADLSQLQGILSDAANKLSVNFRRMTASSDELRHTLRSVGANGSCNELEKLGAIVDEMASTSGTTVMGLQFEDMATQLLQHVDRKLRVLADLTRDMTVINPTTHHEPPFLRSEELDRLFAMLEGYRNRLEVTTRKVVQQQSLESGDIELF